MRDARCVHVLGGGTTPTSDFSKGLLPARGNTLSGCKPSLTNDTSLGLIPKAWLEASWSPSYDDHPGSGVE